MIELNELARDALETAIKREEKGQLKSDTMSTLKHCAEEVCEATEAFFHWKYFQGKKNKNCLAEELADVITCALIVAAREGTDIEAALLRVQEKNTRRAE